jgi:hypothetical protein
MAFNSPSLRFLIMGGILGLACSVLAQESPVQEPIATLPQEKLPFEVGDSLEITPTVPLRKDITIIQSAKVQEILGRWAFVKAKVGGSDESFWINLDNVLLLKIGKPGKK